MHWPELATRRPARKRRREPSPYAPYGCLTPWETATDVEEATLPGLLPRRWLFGLTFVCALGVAFLWGPLFGFWVTLAAALVLGRLVAMDLTTYTLPHVYTVPLVLVGWVHAGHEGRLLLAWLAAIGLGVADAVLARTRLRAGVGGGDTRLLMAMFAFLRPEDALMAIGLGCLLWVPLVLKSPRAMVPLGVPLVAGWVLWVRFSPSLLGAFFGG